MLLRAYGAQISDCISAAFGHIPGEATSTPLTNRPELRAARGSEAAGRMGPPRSPCVAVWRGTWERVGGSGPVGLRANVAEGGDMQSLICPP